ncbi:SixA phosphatase family protein [Aequorivita xiaoshiensis]|uniref:Histidine phosphatase family protein n=1 Tax=Aequorivita xiaoshiensis TaxID=2874476 RepID=A0A9X1R4N2_9FLAO|nr:phosphoglycerate mutase family protein [Aequorivita xiaoshiensis]MCG2430974.1 histidine phosphatase family protein [Aequorivita xiaoshiensis]
MKQFLFLMIFMPLFTFCGQKKEKNNEKQSSEETSEVETPLYKATYYLIRHAEKDRTDPENEDPSLNIDGMVRAKNWAKYFETIKIDEIYITKYIRTKQTVSFIAQQKAISPKIYNPNTLYSVDFLKETHGKTVLISGHSNTTPMLVNKLIGEQKFIEMDNGDNATLFKVTLDGNNRNVETLKVE